MQPSFSAICLAPAGLEACVEKYSRDEFQCGDGHVGPGGTRGSTLAKGGLEK